MCMGKVATENRVRKLFELDAEIDRLQAEIDAIKAELQADMVAEGEDERETKSYVIRYKEEVSYRLDTPTFKKEQPEMYDAYKKEQRRMKFTKNLRSKKKTA